MKHKIPFPLPTIHPYDYQKNNSLVTTPADSCNKTSACTVWKNMQFLHFFFQISLWKSFCRGFFGNMLYIRFSAAQGSCLDTWPCLFKNNGLNLPGFPNMNQRSWWAFCLPNRLGFHQINLPLVLYRSDKSPQVQSMKD